LKLVLDAKVIVKALIKTPSEGLSSVPKHGQLIDCGSMNQREKLDAIRTANIAKITVIGRKTGRSIALPVQFVHEENKILLLPFIGKKTSWYANLTKNPAITIDIGGNETEGKSKAIDRWCDVGKRRREIQGQVRRE
jgi:deazaflavin-dependent oxidoreductase (nitroreductase family)